RAKSTLASTDFGISPARVVPTAAAGAGAAVVASGTAGAVVTAVAGAGVSPGARVAGAGVVAAEPGAGAVTLVMNSAGAAGPYWTSVRAQVGAAGPYVTFGVTGRGSACAA